MIYICIRDLRNTLTNERKGKQYFNNVIKAGTTVATVTSTALTIYNNYDKIKKIISGTSD